MVQPRLIKMYASACVVLKPPIQEGEMKISMHFFSGAVGLYVFGIVLWNKGINKWHLYWPEGFLNQMRLFYIHNDDITLY